MKETKIHNSIGGRQVKPLRLNRDQIDASALAAVQQLGIGLDAHDILQMAQLHGMAEGIGMDALTPGLFPGSIPTPVQFLQQWLPGFVYVMTQARKIDELIGVQNVGSWEDEQIIQGSLELTGTPREYGDYSNIPLSSWNPSWNTRTVVRFEEGLRVGKLEDARAGRVNINTSAAKRDAAALALDIIRNRVGFFGYNTGSNATYGFLNDPNLPAYVTVAAGAGGDTEWSTKTFLEITGDIRSAFSALRTQSGDVIDPESTDITLAVATEAVDYLSVTNVQGTQSVREWLRQSYPRTRLVSAPELNDANGGDSVFYLYAEQIADNGTDDGRTFVQLVPSKFQLIGVEQQAKAYVEDYSNALAGVMVKRPWAIVRRSGI